MELTYPPSSYPQVLSGTIENVDIVAHARTIVSVQKTPNAPE